MQIEAEMMTPRSTADIVYERLYEEIVNLEILPGSKISEAEVGRRFGVSRQPVRDAFKRLGNLDLLEIRPQRATVVRRFSIDEIANTRFVRLSVELEVIEAACKNWTDANDEALQANLSEQRALLEAGETEAFHQLDYSFHKSICEMGGHPMAFETIDLCKRKVDRLCVLSLIHDQAAHDVLDDHTAIAKALANRSVAEARAVTRKHLSRLDDTISQIHKAHAEYFQ
ncbi:GntR family transcriptional regulator [Celeribacter arenosi]|uniref:GntR family transcriptional regulator n=1 Tax=Celeribacter arenosi TaxID=792649 RepID=A0ABP7JWW9_9RHOB